MSALLGGWNTIDLPLIWQYNDIEVKKRFKLERPSLTQCSISRKKKTFSNWATGSSRTHIEKANCDVLRYIESAFSEVSVFGFLADYSLETFSPLHIFWTTCLTFIIFRNLQFVMGWIPLSKRFSFKVIVCLDVVMLIIKDKIIPSLMNFRETTNFESGAKKTKELKKSKK